MTFQVLLEPSGIRFAVNAGQTVLAGALAQGIPLRHGCASGSCGDCKGVLLEGEAEQGPFLPLILSPQERAAGTAILCKLKPRSDLRIRAELSAPLHWEGEVVALEPLAHDVMGLWLTPDRPYPYRAGQYLRVEVPGYPGVWRSYSIAHRPREDGRIGLQIRRAPNGLFSTHLFASMRPGDRLRMGPAQGEFRLHGDSPRDILCVAAGTGLAPIEAILEECLALGRRQGIHLFYGARRRRDLYHLERLRVWAEEYPQFRFTPTVSDPEERDWDGPRRLLPTVAAGGDWREHEVYLCGSPGLVEAATDLLLSHGVRPGQIHFDAFTPGA